MGESKLRGSAATRHPPRKAAQPWGSAGNLRSLYGEKGLQELAGAKGHRRC